MVRPLPVHPGADRTVAAHSQQGLLMKPILSSPELSVELRKFNSLPPSYKHRKRPYVPYKTES